MRAVGTQSKAISARHPGRSGPMTAVKNREPPFQRIARSAFLYRKNRGTANDQGSGNWGAPGILVVTRGGHDVAPGGSVLADHAAGVTLRNPEPIDAR